MEQNRFQWASAAQLGLALIGLSLFWSTAFMMLAWGIIGVVTSGLRQSDPMPVFMAITPLMAGGALLIPSVHYPLMRLRGKPAPDSIPYLRKLKPAWWVVLIPIVIGAGYLVSKIETIAWLALPPLHVLAVGIPVAWILYLGIRGLPKGSSQRMWGVFNTGMSLSPLLIMIMEVLAGITFVILIAIYLYSQPGMFEKLMQLVTKLQDIKSEEGVLELLGPYLTNPLVITAGLLFVGLIVPAIEELIKPIGVWLLAGRKITPAAGFVAGALSGAGYGFIESLILSSSTEAWTALVVARIGTSGVHILTSALTGWAIVQTWQGRHFGRLALAYLCAVLIHGLWNGLTVLYSFQILAQMQNLPLKMPLVESIAIVAPFGLVLLAGGCFFGLIGANSYLNRQLASRNLPSTSVSLPEEGSESML